MVITRLRKLKSVLVLGPVIAVSTGHLSGLRAVWNSVSYYGLEERIREIGAHTIYLVVTVIAHL